MTDDGQSYKFVYDVFGRLRQIKDQSSNLVEEYRYNGLNHRLSWHYDTDIDGDCDGSDKTYYFCYDDQWRIVATFRESDTSPKERFLYHGGWHRRAFSSCHRSRLCDFCVLVRVIRHLFRHPI